MRYVRFEKCRRVTGPRVLFADHCSSWYTWLFVHLWWSCVVLKLHSFCPEVDFSLTWQNLWEILHTQISTRCSHQSSLIAATTVCAFCTKKNRRKTAWLDLRYVQVPCFSDSLAKLTCLLLGDFADFVKVKVNSNGGEMCIFDRRRVRNLLMRRSHLPGIQTDCWHTATRYQHSLIGRHSQVLAFTTQCFFAL